MAGNQWHFECPECGYDDQEAGALADDAMRDCPLCASDSGHQVSLVRWPTGTPRPAFHDRFGNQR